MIIDKDLIQKVIRPRPPVSHKGTFGRVLLIGGLYPYGGAIIMAALSCVNSGAGLVMVATDRENIGALHAHLPEAMAFDVNDMSFLEEQIRLADLVLIGPGLGESLLAQDLFKKVKQGLAKHQILVVDGSALRLLATFPKETINCSHLILTPHQKEWETLSGLTPDIQTREMTQKALRQFQVGTILVAKSHKTSLFAWDGRIAELSVGGPYQATGGMGDTLAGMIAGFLVQFKDDIFETVLVATHLHSAIADELSRQAYVVLPSQISSQLPRVMKTFSEKKG